TPRPPAAPRWAGGWGRSVARPRSRRGPFRARGVPDRRGGGRRPCGGKDPGFVERGELVAVVDDARGALLPELPERGTHLEADPHDLRFNVHDLPGEDRPLGGPHETEGVRYLHLEPFGRVVDDRVGDDLPLAGELERHHLLDRLPMARALRTDGPGREVDRSARGALRPAQVVPPRRFAPESCDRHGSLLVGPLEEVDDRGRPGTSHVLGEPEARPRDLPFLRLASELADELDHLGDADRPERPALRL